jgi:hypothetical protein
MKTPRPPTCAASGTSGDRSLGVRRLERDMRLLSTARATTATANRRVDTDRRALTRYSSRRKAGRKSGSWSFEVPESRSTCLRFLQAMTCQPFQLGRPALVNAGQHMKVQITSGCGGERHACAVAQTPDRQIVQEKQDRW